MSGNSNRASGAYDAFDGGLTSKPEVSSNCPPAHNILDADSPASLLPFMGGKAANLYRLSGSALPVPQWVCLSSQICSDVLAEIQHVIDVHLSGVDYDRPDSVQQASDAVRTLIEQTIISDSVRHDIERALDTIDASYYAVRSSGLVEDSSTGSFAGQFDTYLYVRRADVVDHIKHCWASAFTPGNLAYTHCLGVEKSSHSVAVIIQAMVDSEKAGVMFMANPAGSIDDVVIVSGYGLGEGVVSDQVETDTYIYDRTRCRWRSEIGDKAKRVRFDAARGQGTTLANVEAANRHEPVLSAEQREVLRVSGEIISGLYDDFQDIEWAFDAAGELFITQSRPITTIPGGTQTVFDNSNIVESYPGITSPLTVSHIRAAYETLFRNALLRIGISKRSIRQNDHLFKNMLGYLGGRVYYNLTNWYQMFRLVPAVEPYLPVWEEMLGINKNNDRARQSWSKRLTQAPRLMWVALRILWHFTFLKFYMENCARSFRLVQSRFRERNVTELDNHQLAELHHRLTAEVLDGWEITLLNDLFAFVFTATVRRQLRKIGIDENVFGGLMAGDNSLESAVPVRSLILMAEIVRSDPVLKQQLHDALAMPQTDFRLRQIDELFDNEKFVHQLTHHLERFGDRSPEELKLESASFREDPQSLLQLVSSYIVSNVELAKLDERRFETRENAVADLRTALRGHPFKRLWITWSMALTRRSIRYRESSRLDRARAFGLIREIFCSLGKNLADEGVLSDSGDVFYLTVDEVLGFITGSSVNDSLKGMVVERKADRECHQQLGPAERIRTQGTVRANVVPPKVRGTAICAKGTLQGTGCSAGLITAEAVLVRNPADAGDVKGKVLIAEMTDPGWVFLMVSAAGLVVEKGSLLSHTAIIGRELGIPTVVGVEGATELIRNGQVVQVNGQTGRLVLQGESNE